MRGPSNTAALGANVVSELEVIPGLEKLRTHGGREGVWRCSAFGRQVDLEVSRDARSVRQGGTWQGSMTER
ncbi:hypothetical protein MKX07_000591 [Trichoderma sp. CBMAI-0711]|nr:hypothetical protein MKX07_000591 [Trichoderma sp. CBMAI-0711]